MVRGALIGSVRDQRALFRSDSVDETQKIIRREAFDVELDAEFAGESPQFMDVAGARVPLVRPRMHGDPGGSGGDAQSSESAHIGQAVVSCVSQQGDFVEVRTEGGHRAGFRRGIEGAGKVCLGDITGLFDGRRATRSRSGVATSRRGGIMVGRFRRFSANGRIGQRFSPTIFSPRGA